MSIKSKTPPNHLVSCRYLTLCRWVLDLSIIQGPFSITKCQTLISRFATFASQYDAPPPPLHHPHGPRRCCCCRCGTHQTEGFRDVLQV
jgi:hypothetical protein